MPPGDWSPDPTPTSAEHVHDGHDIDCPDCAITEAIAEAGARSLTADIGVEWDDVTDPHVRSHYMVIASNVMAAMSAKMIDLAVVKETSRG